MNLKKKISHFNNLENINFLHKNQILYFTNSKDVINVIIIKLLYFNKIYFFVVHNLKILNGF